MYGRPVQALHPMGPAMGTARDFATLEYTNNGILVRYSEPAKRRQKTPSPLQGFDNSYIAMILEIISAQTGGEDWDDDKKEARKERMTKALKDAKLPTEDRIQEFYAMEEKTIFCQTLEELPEAIKTAYDAYMGMISLQKEGEMVQYL